MRHASTASRRCSRCYATALALAILLDGKKSQIPTQGREDDLSVQLAFPVRRNGLVRLRSPSPLPALLRVRLMNRGDA